MSHLTRQRCSALTVVKAPSRGRPIGVDQDTRSESLINAGANETLELRLSYEQGSHPNIAAGTVGAGVVRCQRTRWLVLPLTAQRRRYGCAGCPDVRVRCHDQQRLVDEAFSHRGSVSNRMTGKAPGRTTSERQGAYAVTVDPVRPYNRPFATIGAPCNAEVLASSLIGLPVRVSNAASG